MKRSIFISRKLPEDSALFQFLVENNWEVHHFSLIRIEPIPFQIEKEYDWIFLSSSNGAKLLFGSFMPPDHTKIGVVGEATANAARKFGIYPDLIGRTGDMKELADLLSRNVGDDSILFAGAEGGSEKVRSAIPSAQTEFIPVYRTLLRDDLDIPQTDAVFLTSPSNANAYLRKASLEGRTVVAIGQTTAEFLTRKGVAQVLVPATPNEEDVIGLFGGI